MSYLKIGTIKPGDLQFMTGINMRSFLRGLFKLLFQLLTRIDNVGMDNLPEHGAFILVSNHLSLVDSILVFVLLNRQDATGFVAKKHQKNFFFRWVANSVNGIWLNRLEPDAHAFRVALEHLENGGIFGISPEGTRSPTKSLIPAKSGVALLADQAKVPILPVGIYGTENLLAEWLSLRRPQLTIHFGKPFNLPPVDKQHRSEGLKNNTDEIMCRIAALLPLQYRGVYTDNPRIQELITFHN
jgi:1-acyl-sn-glycerol-3-phosphate acyltransferase